MKSKKIVLAIFPMVLMLSLSTEAVADCQGGSAAGRLSCTANNVFSQQATRQADDAAEAARRAAREAEANVRGSKRVLDQAASQKKQLDASLQSQKMAEQAKLNDQASQNAAAMAARRKAQQASQSTVSQPNQSAAIAKMKQDLDQAPAGKSREELGAAIHKAEQRAGQEARLVRESSTTITKPNSIALFRNSNINKARLSRSGSQIDPADKSGQLTRAGRALQKHSNRPNSSFSKTSGPPANWNNAGQTELSKILNDQSSQIKYGNRFNGYDIYRPNGQGAAFDNNNTFRTFLEPARSG